MRGCVARRAASASSSGTAVMMVCKRTLGWAACTIAGGHYASRAPAPKVIKELIQLFAQIALLRRGPQDLPASGLLLGLTMLAYVAVTFIMSSLLPPARGWPEQVLVTTLFTLLWYVVLLRACRR